MKGHNRPRRRQLLRNCRVAESRRRGTGQKETLQVRFLYEGQKKTARWIPGGHPHPAFQGVRTRIRLPLLQNLGIDVGLGSTVRHQNQLTNIQIKTLYESWSINVLRASFRAYLNTQYPYEGGGALQNPPRHIELTRKRTSFVMANYVSQKHHFFLDLPCVGRMTSYWILAPSRSSLVTKPFTLRKQLNTEYFDRPFFCSPITLSSARELSRWALKMVLNPQRRRTQSPPPTWET